MTTDLTPADGGAHEKAETPMLLIFRASRLYRGIYLGDCLPVQPWQWPRHTWLQERLEKIRKEQNGNEAQAVASDSHRV